MQHLLLEVANLKERHFLCLHFRTFQNVNACSVSRKMHHLIFSCGWDNIYWKSSCLVARMGQIYPTKIPLRDRDGNRNEVITETLFLSPYEDFCPSSFLFLFLFLYSYFLRIRTDIPYSSLSRIPGLPGVYIYTNLAGVLPWPKETIKTETKPRGANEQNI